VTDPTPTGYGDKPDDADDMASAGQEAPLTTDDEAQRDDD
jgi:hypothetical protein